MRNYIDYNTFESHVKNLGYQVFKLDVNYNQADHRCWTAVINPGAENFLVTFTINKGNFGAHYFDLVTQDRTIMDIYTSDIYDIITDLLGKTPVVLTLDDEA
jgi:hypothetical protein